MVKIRVVLEAPRIRLCVRASCTHGYERIDHSVPHLRVPSVWHTVQDDTTRATRSVHVITGVHDALGWYNTLCSLTVRRRARLGTLENASCAVAPTISPPFHGGVTRDGIQVRSAEKETIKAKLRESGFGRNGSGFECGDGFGRKISWRRRRRGGFGRRDCYGTFRSGEGVFRCTGECDRPLCRFAVPATHYAFYLVHIRKKLCIRFIE